MNRPKPTPPALQLLPGGGEKPPAPDPLDTAFGRAVLLLIRRGYIEQAAKRLRAKRGG